MEAATVRHIYQRYSVLKSVRDLGDELYRDGVGSAARVGQDATSYRPLERGALRHLLQNRLYRGDITHKGQVYPGQHQAIIAPELWDQVQATLAANQVERRIRPGATGPSLLTGLVYDAIGERLSPTHANKKGTRYRYYVSKSLIRPQAHAEQSGSSHACRLPAADLEELVETALCDALRDAPAVHDIARAACPDDAALQKLLLTAAAELADTLPTATAAEKISTYQTLLDRVIVRSDAVEIQVGAAALISLGLPHGNLTINDPGHQQPTSDALAPLTRIVPAQLTRTGMQVRLLIEGRSEVTRGPDRSLVRLVARAHQFRRALMASDGGKTMAELADEAGVTSSYYARVVRLAFLSPQLTADMLTGRHPVALTANKLQHLQQLPNAWAEQPAALASA